MWRSKRAGVLVVVLGACLASASAGWAQDTEQGLRDEIESLKQGQEQIRQDLAEIKRLLQRQQAPAGPNVEGKVFDLRDNPVLGEPSAKLTLVEFTDYQ